MSTDTTDRWLRMGEATSLARVCRPTMRRWCEEGLVTASKLPGRGDWRIREDSILALLNGEKTRALVVDHLRRVGL